MKLLQFWLLVFALSLPVWAISTQVKVAGLPLDVPVTDFAITLYTGDSGLYSCRQKRGRDRGQKAVEKSVRFFENWTENLVFPDVAPDACNLLRDCRQSIKV